MTTNTVSKLVDHFDRCLRSGGTSTFSYEQLLLIEQRHHLDAFIKNQPFPPFEVEIQVSSSCNLRCAWCIGDEVQAKRKVLRLPNSINEQNVDLIVDGIINFTVGEMTIDTVRFSGFIGEPLVNKRVTLKAIQRLVGANRRVGLFTNAVLMGPDTWTTLKNIDYVHVSLDSGPSSFFWLKKMDGEPYTTLYYDTVLKNIEGLNAARLSKSRPGRVKINVGYVVVPGNHDEIITAARQVRQAGADSIRFKCDIGGKYDLRMRPEALDRAYEEIENLTSELHNPPQFSVHVIHSRQDVETASYAGWSCKDGCYYQHFLGTVGSDGNLYLCDHNTMPGAVPLGSVIEESFQDVWESERKLYLAGGVQYTCQCSVCPPFGNKANTFLRTIHQSVEDHGPELVMKAIQQLRAQYTL